MNIMLMVKNRYCCDCVFEDVCELDSTMYCENCQVLDAILDDISWKQWSEMSYNKYVGGLLDFNWDEYSDGE